MNFQTLGLFLLARVSGTMMGVSQKFLANYSPLLVNGIAQGVACLLFLVLFGFFKNQGEGFSLHPAMLLLGIAFVGLNYGYSALYGHGVALAYVPIIVTGGMTILLGIAGWMWFGETITWQFVLGSAVVLVGMGIMVIE